MSRDDFFDDFHQYLPKYLFPRDKRELFEELKAFPENTHYYLNKTQLQEKFLQGDGWRGFVIIDFHTLKRKPCSGVILSNTCDIDVSHDRPVPPNVLFCPIMRLAKYVEILTKGGKGSSYINQHVSDIRRQRVTSMFYLPSKGEEFQESVAILGDIHSHPLRDFVNGKRTSLFTLNQYSFYLFLFKVSIHLTRFQEDVRRFDGSPS